jgi:hypothetical protein
MWIEFRDTNDGPCVNGFSIGPASRKRRYVHDGKVYEPACMDGTTMVYRWTGETVNGAVVNTPLLPVTWEARFLAMETRVQYLEGKALDLQAQIYDQETRYQLVWWRRLVRWLKGLV